ncbi:MAG: GNAT family N-acetyltransferase, partial [Gammaproteobacteria bacterium]
GWNPGLYDADSFYAQDPHGFFVGRLNDEVIGCCSAVTYEQDFAFFGSYVVKEGYRDQGYGIQMTRHRLAYVGSRLTGLDGVLNMCDKYANLGFRPAHMNIRQAGLSPIHSVEIDPHVFNLQEDMLPDVFAYDRLYFPAARPQFLEQWLRPPAGKVFVYIEKNDIQGYGVIRQCYTGHKIGPLFAETPAIAEKILQALLSTIPGEPFFLDTPEPNQHALALADSYNAKPSFKTLRMYLHGQPDVNLNNVFGITSFELG